MEDRGGQGRHGAGRADGNQNPGRRPAAPPAERSPAPGRSADQEFDAGVHYLSRRSGADERIHPLRQARPLASERRPGRPGFDAAGRIVRLGSKDQQSGPNLDHALHHAQRRFEPGRVIAGADRRNGGTVAGEDARPSDSLRQGPLHRPDHTAQRRRGGVQDAAQSDRTEPRGRSLVPGHTGGARTRRRSAGPGRKIGAGRRAIATPEARLAVHPSRVGWFGHLRARHGRRSHRRVPGPGGRARPGRLPQASDGWGQAQRPRRDVGRQGNRRAGRRTAGLLEEPHLLPENTRPDRHRIPGPQPAVFLLSPGYEERGAIRRVPADLRLWGIQVRGRRPGVTRDAGGLGRRGCRAGQVGTAGHVERDPTRRPDPDGGLAAKCHPDPLPQRHRRRPGSADARLPGLVQAGTG